MRALFHPGLFTAHDIWHQVARIYHYYQAINDGQIPPYWIGTLAQGLGYPLFFFSYHLPWIVSLPILALGFDIPTTLKILFFLAYFLSGISMYLFASSLFKSKIAALFSSILYLWAPYHFLTVLVSASIGTLFVFIFLPLLLWGLYLANQQQNQRYGIALISLGLMGIILSHLMTIFSIIPLLILFIIYQFTIIKDKKRVRKIIYLKTISLGLILGLFLSSFYLLPAIYYNQFTQSHKETGFASLYQKNFINTNQLLYSKWGYGPIINNAKDGEISFQVGIAQWLSIFSLLLLIVFKKINRSVLPLTLFLLLSFFLSIFMMLDFSKPIWDILTRFASLDYPTRFMLAVTFLGSIIGGLVLISLSKKLKTGLFLILVSVSLYTNRNHIRVNLYTDVAVSVYVASEITTNTFNEYLPILADARLLGESAKIVEPKNLSVTNFKQNTKSFQLDLSVDRQTTVSIKQFYFPGQTLYIDNKKVNYTIDKRGRISFSLSEGSHHIRVEFEETLLIKISKFLTVISLILILLILFSKRKSPL